jgi:hypothetical protein
MREVEELINYIERNTPWQVSTAFADSFNVIEEGKSVAKKILEEAGFKVGPLVVGKIEYHVRGTPIDSDRPTFINPNCPFKVLDLSGNDYTFATGWLNDIWYTISFPVETRSEFDHRLVDYIIAEEIRRSVPFSPITLTVDNDLLEEYEPQPGSFPHSYFVNHIRDKESLNGVAGKHMHCGGTLERMRVSEKSDALVCRRCYLRVLFLNTVQTYGDLRRALSSK